MQPGLAGIVLYSCEELSPPVYLSKMKRFFNTGHDDENHAMLTFAADVHSECFKSCPHQSCSGVNSHHYIYSNENLNHDSSSSVSIIIDIYVTKKICVKVNLVEVNAVNAGRVQSK